MGHGESFSAAEFTTASGNEQPGHALQTDEFVRVEDKFLVPIHHRDELLELLYQKSRPSYLKPDVRYLGIESVYYESPTFQSFRDHFLSKTYRYKLRTRRYAPNGVLAVDETHLELKSKDGETSRKFRFRLASGDLARLNEFLPIRMSSELVQLNLALPGEELRRRARQISRLVAEKSLTPVCRVLYRREAFERKGVRVTLDMDLRSELLRPVGVDDAFGDLGDVREQAERMTAQFLSAPHALLEVKHHGIIPKWLDRFLRERTPGKIGFSKYCFSITQQLLRLAVRK